MFKIYKDSFYRYMNGFYCPSIMENRTSEIKSRNKVYRFEKPDECPICMEHLDYNEEPLICGHWVHSKCLSKCNKDECPLCRTVLYIKTKKVNEKDFGNSIDMQIIIKTLVLIGTVIEYGYEICVVINKISYLLSYFK